MDIKRFMSKTNHTIAILKYIYLKKRFSAQALEKKFEISHTTVYRYLALWCSMGLINKIKNGMCNEYRITSKLLEFFSKFREELLNILLTTSIIND